VVSKPGKISFVIEQVRKYVQQQRLLQPGDRMAVAVSGGADSVALLRILLELRQDLGIVLSTAHFHHGIRGAEADADQAFVKELAQRFELELHLGSGDVPEHARGRKLSLETAARELRHQWFAQLVCENRVDKIATAHTIDDQAETVLMRILRGAGSRGLAGIFPAQKEKHLVRPLLGSTRREIEAYLVSQGQPWRVDSSNRDLSHTRNRIRHQLLPELERDFNPNIRQALADLAEVAHSETEYWDAEISSLMTRVLRPGKPSRSGRTASGDALRTLALDLGAFHDLPAALQRQVLHEIARRLGIALEFKHIQQLTELANEKASGKRLLLPGEQVAVRTFRELQFSPAEEGSSPPDYRYLLAIPGEVTVPELGSVIRARVVDSKQRGQCCSTSLLNRSLLAAQVTVRNWRAGDKFFPANTRSPKKLKELLQAGRLGRELSLVERRMWPLIESEGQIIWVRGFATPAAFMAKEGDAVVIEEVKIGLEAQE
jgi:tRNA(Ile)-lysidine synthase